MSAKFYTLLTDIGAAKLASAAALGVPLKITHMAVGDGGGVLPTPSAQQTKLVAEKRRASLNMLYIDPQNSSQIIAEQVIPETEGGWWIREIGLFDETGALIAVGNCPESYKPQLAEGSGRTQTVRMVLITSSTDNITLKIDPAVVLATRQYVDDTEIEVRLYTDEAMKAHLAEANPHPQYLQAKNNLSELTDKSKARGSLELGSAATKDVGTEAGNVIGVGGFGLGAEKISTTTIDFKTRIFRAGESLLIKMEGSTNVPTGLPTGPGQYMYAHCLGVRDNSYGCTVVFVMHNNAALSFLGTRFDNVSSGWILMRVGNQAELSKYLSLAGGNITGRLGVSGVLEVGKTGTESLITLGASTVLRDNANNALVISSESGAGSKAGVFLRPIASTDSTMQMQGNADGWFTDKFTPKILKVPGKDAIIKSGAYSYTEGSQTFNQVDGLFMQSVGGQYGNIRFTEMVGKRSYISFEIKGGDKTAWLEFRHNGSFVINGTDIAPVGIPQPWPLATAPLGWLICNGATFDKAMYPFLAAAYPSGKLPDLRGEFIRGWDNGRGVDPGRSLLAWQDDMIKKHSHTLGTYKSVDAGIKMPVTAGAELSNSGVGGAMYTGEAGSSETRPRNIAFNYIVRAA
ncbi:phage tail-collar fiber domain-containing protein [Klebsiella aerogenes]|uniref:phage tail-collar fiber domain-containing protein n=1 Tax=Klebsiella aerogenes TaxID=548 RepID=UPI001D0D9AA8|nr:phage tail protein [Klebsiella aerogenes]